MSTAPPHAVRRASTRAAPPQVDEDAFADLPDTARRIVRGAVEAFAARGFHATTTRDIARRAGLSPAGLYVHYPSKAAVLGQVSRLGHERALALVSESLSGEQRPSVTRLAAVVRDFVTWHARHHTTARVVQNELDALAPLDRAAAVDLRRRTEALVEAEVRRGVARGELAVADPHAVTRAVLSLCIDVARWYDPAGRESPTEIADLYATLVLRMLGADPARGTETR
ncbi:MAG: TetR/AcrR family transcriptional regulator [Rhodoferax sp.]|nr:TetR/AcrR family transcriptional regulator [Actinomycetota bacterium]